MIIYGVNMRYNEILNEAAIKALYSNQPEAVVNALLTKGSFVAKQGYTSLSTSKNVANELDDLSSGGSSYGGDVLFTFDANELSKINTLIRIVYKASWFKDKPDLLKYVTGLKWVEPKTAFYAANKAFMEKAHEQYFDEVDENWTVEDIIQLVLDGSAFEREVVVKSPFKYVDGMITKADFSKKPSDALVTLLKQHGIKIAGLSQISQEEKRQKAKYDSGVSVEDFLKSKGAKSSTAYKLFQKLKDKVNQEVRITTGGTGIIDRIYFNKVELGSGPVYYGSVSLKNKEGQITHYAVPFEFIVL